MRYWLELIAIIMDLIYYAAACTLLCAVFVILFGVAVKTALSYF